MSDITEAFLAVLVGLFPIVNPLGGAPLFLRLTAEVSPAARAALAGRVAIGGYALLLGSMFIGSHILSFFGLSLPAVQVAGGLVIVAAGWKLLQQGEDLKARTQPSGLSDEAVVTRAFYPLTMPLTVGPGSMTVAIALGAHHAPSSNIWLESTGAALGAGAVAVAIYVCYRFADRVLGLLGEAGRDVFLRLSAFILLCLGVQILWNGYSNLLSLTATP